ncbi:MAG: type IX secretion system membrane protein PorP/SprF, partial [Bacteroidota bacterium]
MRLSIFSLLLGCLCCTQLQAQDPFFLHFYGNQSTFNPAFVGRRGARSLTAKYHSQWGHQDARAYRTYQVLLEESMPCFFLDWGLVATRDEEGEGLLTTNEFGFRTALFIPTSRGSTSRRGRVSTFQSNLRIGFGWHWGQRTIDYSRLVFLDQLDPLFGLFDADRNSNATSFQALNGEASPWYFSPSMGISYHHAVDPRKVNSWVFDLGLAIHNASLFVSRDARQTASLRGLDNPLGERIVASFEAEKVLHESNGRFWSLRPQVVLQWQEGLGYAEFGTKVSWSRTFNFGLYYHLAQPVDVGPSTNWASLKLEIGGLSLGDEARFDLGLGYSVQNGGLNNYVAPPLEISVTMHFGKKSLGCSLIGRDDQGYYDKKGPMRCPLFNSGARSKMYDNVWYNPFINKDPQNS